MSETVHIALVGFEHDRLIAPLSRGDLEADRVVLIDTPPEIDMDNGNRAGGPVSPINGDMLERLKDDFENLVGATVDIRELRNMYEFDTVYEDAYRLLNQYASTADDIWVNISDAPGSISFAFEAAIDMLMADKPQFRDTIHMYYVEPDEHLLTDMVECLRNDAYDLQLLNEQLTTALEGLEEGDEQKARREIEAAIDRAADRSMEVNDLIREVDSHGVTRGANRAYEDDYVKFPSFVYPELSEDELETVAAVKDLGGECKVERLREKLLSNGVEVDEGMEGCIDLMSEKGYINRTDDGVELSRVGELWVRTHDIGASPGDD